MEAIARTAPRARTNRERPLVTRHDLHSLHAATQTLRPRSPAASITKTKATGLKISRCQLPSRVRLAKNLTPASPRRPHRRVEPAITTARQNLKSP
jgi:hypothetical protein